MKNSSLLVFSFLINANKIIESEKDNLEDIFNIRYYHYKNCKPYSKEISKRIYNELENNMYNYTDLFIYMLYKYAFNEKLKSNSIYANEVKRVRNIFTKNQLKKDENFINEINKTIKLKTINEFFEIRENGEPIIFELIKKQYVTPVFYVKYYEKVLTDKNKDVIFMSKEYEKFKYAMNVIVKIIKGGLDEQEKVCN